MSHTIASARSASYPLAAKVPPLSGLWQNGGMRNIPLVRVIPALAFCLTVATLMMVAVLPVALAARQASGGTLERAKVHGKSLEGNLSGDSPDRDVSVYLPPSYASSPGKRYPVIYMLHGYTDSDDKWMGPTKHWINLPSLLDRGIAAGTSAELIVVMPNAYTRFEGSMYSSSVSTGDWESYIAKELVAWVDRRYRTLPTREGRGIAGHSMGGYGAMRIGMKHPDVFSSVYLLSPCCLAPMRAAGGRPLDGPHPAQSIKSDEEFQKASFGVKIAIASAAAWAPNPNNPPFYLDLPAKEGVPQPEVLARMATNAPLAQLDQYIYALRTLNGLAFDAGDKDTGIAETVRALHARLEAYGVPHQHAIYEGDHVNRVSVRIETEMLPFFSKRLRRE